MSSKSNYTRLFSMMIVLLICNISYKAYGDISQLVEYPQYPNYVTLKELSNKVESLKNRQVYQEMQYGWKPTKRTVERKLYSQNGSTYTYKVETAYTRFGHPNESYSDPFASCLSYPVTDATLTVTPTYLKLYIVEQIQVDCDFGGANNDPIRPKDVMRTDLECSSGTKKAQMEGENGRLICPFTTSCSHSIYQTPRRTGIKGRNSSGGSFTFGTPGGNEGDPYAPWRLKHKQTITINFATMAKANKITKQELAWELIRGGLKYIPSSSKGETYKVFRLNEEMRILLVHFLWKTFKLESYLTKRSKEVETKGIELWKVGDFEMAADHMIASYNMSPTNNRLDMICNIKYDELKADLDANGVYIYKVMDYINTYPYKENKYIDNASEIISSFITNKKDSVRTSIMNNISINTCYSDILAAIAISDDNKEASDLLSSKKNEYFKQRDNKALEMMACFTKKTPVEFIDSAFYYANEQSTQTLILEKQKQFKNNYKLIKDQYVNVKGIWYEIAPGTNEASVSISRGKEYKGNIKIPEEIIVKSKTYKVCRINDCAFANCFKIKTVELPASITKIGDQAFYGCKYLTIIDIPHSVTHIGNESFAHCINLSKVTLPNQLNEIPSGCFYNCNLDVVTIPSAVKCIGNQAFSKNEKLTSVNLPNSIQYIGANAFNTYGETISLRFQNNTVPNIPMTFFAPFDKLSVNIESDNVKSEWKKHNTWCKYIQ